MGLMDLLYRLHPRFAQHNDDIIHLHRLTRSNTMGSNDNYPAGVTDAHPHFNPAEGSFAVECGADEALVIPSFAVKAALIELVEHLEQKERMGGINHSTIKYRVIKLRKLIEEMEQEREYECGFKDTLDLDISEEAHWDCPRCGNERTTDTVPEERDPDEGWDSRYDD